MGWIKARLQEPSSAAGLTLALNALPALLVNPRDGQAWGGLIGGLLAVLLRERAR